ncbi:MAG TPA: DUF6351 family protein [Solirubrobacterales bacterium]|nr:DUF6351 family protein [Solirubrobacterales bacterium]
MALAACALACSSWPAAAEAKDTARADWFTLATGPLERGQIELLTISTLPDTVSGGEVLVGVRGLTKRDRLKLQLNGRVAKRAKPTPRRVRARSVPGERRVVIRGLRRGINRIRATAIGPGRDRSAILTVRNHPTTGPIASGPHQKPFYCETDESELGPPADRDCSAPTSYKWFYRSRLDLAFHELTNPYGPYPADVGTATTSDGRAVPFVVRVESATINRGVTRIAVLDDPASRGPDGTFAPNWNGRLTHSFGESCGSGYRQGSSEPERVLGGLTGELSADSIFQNIYGLSERLAAGDAISMSTMTTFGVYCNPAVSPETLMMIKEHVSETYGAVERTLAVGGSGGALQTYNAASNFPGLIDGGIVVASFPDIPSTAMTVIDCGLLLHYWATTGVEWSDTAKTAVAGHINPTVCESWQETFLPLLHPTEGCDGEVPDEVRYDPETNRKGVRCSLQDALVNLVGTERRTGFARLPYDNVGVQYGLAALNAGKITPAQFIDLNRRVGGYDLDSNPVPRRSRMAKSLAKRMYALGGVIGRGPLHRTPIIDLGTYLDPIPIANIHDVVRPFQIRARLRTQKGSTVSQSIWRGISTPADAFRAMDRWLAGVEAREATGRVHAVAAGKPRAAEDKCVLGTLGAAIEIPDGLVLPTGLTVELLPALLGSSPLISLPLGAFISETQEVGRGVCDLAFPANLEPRIVAGGPLSDDVLKCRRKPVDPSDYDAPLSGAELAELREIFPTGVCDFSRRGYGEEMNAKPWPTIGGRRLQPLDHLKWRTARSG